MKMHNSTRAALSAPLLAWVVFGCSADDGYLETSNTVEPPSQPAGAAAPSTSSGEPSAGGGPGETATGGDSATGATSSVETSTGGSPGETATGGMPSGGDGATGATTSVGTSTGGSPGETATGGAPSAGGSATGGADPGPENGDPNAPFTIPEVACGGPEGASWSPTPNHEISGRGYLLTYPCNKGVGAPMTFFLLLHGTTPPEQHFYIHNFYAIHNYSESHNIIVATPGSVVEQWGNGDDGQDEPHLMAIIGWVYATFHGDGKFDIRGMWVGGHSWGSMYTKTFACKEELADKVVGAFPFGSMEQQLSCADRISVMSAAAEDDIGPVIDQGDVPASNGCGAPVESEIGNNVETLWPDCDPGFVYANYFMLGKVHESAIDDVVVARTADLIKGARL
jgi:hypothetical protein